MTKCGSLILLVGFSMFLSYSENLHVDRYVQCHYIQDLTVSFKLMCKPFSTFHLNP